MAPFWKLASQTLVLQEVAWIVENGELFCCLYWMFCFGILILLKKCQLKTLSSRAPEPFPRQSTTSNTKALSCGPAMQTQVLRQRQTRLRNYFSKTPSSSGVEKSRLNFLLIKLTVSIPNFKWRMFIREIIGSSCSSHTKCVTRKKIPSFK